MTARDGDIHAGSRGGTQSFALVFGVPVTSGLGSLLAGDAPSHAQEVSHALD